MQKFMQSIFPHVLSFLLNFCYMRKLKILTIFLNYALVFPYNSQNFLICSPWERTCISIEFRAPSLSTTHATHAPLCLRFASLAPYICRRPTPRPTPFTAQHFFFLLGGARRFAPFTSYSSAATCSTFNFTFFPNISLLF